MLIQEIVNYIELKGRASLSDIALHFRLPESMVESMLQIWVSKKKMGLIDTANCNMDSNCKGCSNACSNARSKLYYLQ